MWLLCSCVYLLASFQEHTVPANTCHCCLTAQHMISDSLWLQELLAAINAAGAAHISFNPVTKANMDKALQQACAESGIQLPGEVVTGIADSASGDLRNGLQTLQLAAVGLPLQGKGTKTSKAKARALSMLAMCICTLCKL